VRWSRWDGRAAITAASRTLPDTMQPLLPPPCLAGAAATVVQPVGECTKRRSFRIVVMGKR
jgi:hypothetical protein